MPHFLSDEGVWKTESEFTDAKGVISRVDGESVITIEKGLIRNYSYAVVNGEKVVNDYRIEPVNERYYRFEAHNPALGTLAGSFRIDRDIIYSKYHIRGESLNGFELVVREGSVCRAYGTLYDGDELINSWVARMEKVE